MAVVIAFNLIFAVLAGAILWSTISRRAVSGGKADVAWTALSITIFYALVWPALQLVGAG